MSYSLTGSNSTLRQTLRVNINFFPGMNAVEITRNFLPIERALIKWTTGISFETLAEISNQNLRTDQLKKESRIVDTDNFPVLHNSILFQDCISNRLRYLIHVEVFILTLHQSAD